MKFGVILPNYGPNGTPRNTLATARTAEKLGYDSIWTTDHVLIPQGEAPRFEHIFEALVTLAYLAGKTTSIRLGVSSLVLPQRNPVLVAKQVASLDMLSRGRVILCVGAGWTAGEFANLGERFDNRGRRTDEAIQVLKLLWRGPADVERNFQGDYYQFHRGMFSPLPLQPAGPPLWIGGNSEAAIRRAARMGDGWHPSRPSCGQLKAGVDLLREWAPGRRITISLRAHLSYDGQDPDALFRGPSQEIVKSLKSYASAGLEYLVIEFRDRTQTARQRSMATFASEVIPAMADGA